MLAQWTILTSKKGIMNIKEMFQQAIESKEYWVKEYSKDLDLVKTYKKELENLEVPDANYYLDAICTDYVEIQIIPIDPSNLKDVKRLRSFCTKHSGKMIRKFNEYSGQFYWEPATPGRIRFILYNTAVLSPQCTIEPYQVEVTRYKSICDEGQVSLERVT